MVSTTRVRSLAFDAKSLIDDHGGIFNSEVPPVVWSSAHDHIRMLEQHVATDRYVITPRFKGAHQC